MRAFATSLALLVLISTLHTHPAHGDDAASPHPVYERGTGFVPASAIDLCVLAELRRRDIEPANPCSDAVFLRRAWIDVIGTLPDPQSARRFLADKDPGKRGALIDDLLAREEFADYWAMKWCDLLRVKAEFPINLWPNGVQAYYRWIRSALRANVPYDRFVRELLTSSGSNYRVPPVNFYRAVRSRTPTGIADAVALTFMGTRTQRWSESRRTAMAAFFSRIVYKPTAEWKEEIVISDPAPAKALEAAFPDGVAVLVPGDADPRRVFADWLVTEQNPWFVRTFVNRVWSWLFGRGIVHEPDDHHPDNPPANAALLACLERAFIASGYDVKALFRLILNSRAWQGSPIPASSHAQAEALFAHYPARRLDAEVLIDALCRLDGRGENYVSQVPEPFTYIPNMRRSIRLADGTITSPFLQMFGRPARDTGLESERDNQPTSAQRLYLLNSSEVQNRLQRSVWLRRLTRGRRANRAGAIGSIYLALLARAPTPAERRTAAAYVGAEGRKLRDGAIDLAWALINTKEFLYRH